MEHCANPLLAQFLREWYDEARALSTKGALTYKKAYESMVRCPVKLNHPSEASRLKGLGEKLCSRLYDELKRHCEREGLPVPEYRPPKKKRRSGDNLPDEVDDEPRPAPAKKARKAKAYVPGDRSGAYAILRALSTLEEDSEAGLTKVQLIDLAQQWCDSSFTATSGPGKFYTAWDSQRTLLDKNLIYVRGRPTKKYALTPEGWTVAKTINRTAGAAAEESLDDSSHSPISRNIRGNENREIIGPLREDANPGRNAHALQNENNPPGKNLAELTIEELQAEIQRRKEAERRVTIATPSQRIVESRPIPEIQTILSSPAQSPPRRRVFEDITDTPPQRRLEVEGSNLEAPLDKLSPSSRPIAPRPTPNLPTINPLVIRPGEYTIHLVLDQREIRSKSDRSYIEDELTKQGVRPIVRALEVGDALWVAKTARPSHLAELGEAPPDPASTTADALNRALASHDEIVLDHIVERKRMDDLASSLKDGRFQEQKFRLKRCGVAHVVYLVEEGGVAKDEPARTFEMLESAIASTQVVDGFFVKRTHKLDDTIRYLVRVTRMLQKTYADRALYVVPSKHLEAATYLPLLKHLKDSGSGTKYNITFTAFASLASKSDTLTLRDVFLKMLMCTRGVTGAKAMEMQKRWRTPREFVEAYEEVCAKAGEEAGKDMVFGVMGGIVGNRKVGKTLSAKVAEIWGGC